MLAKQWQGIGDLYSNIQKGGCIIWMQDRALSIKKLSNFSVTILHLEIIGEGNNCKLCKGHYYFYCSTI